MLITNKTFIYSAILILFLCANVALAQITKVMGTVSDSETNEPVPFANIYFQGTTIGVTSDFEGNFSIETKTPTDSLVASVMG